MFVAAQPVMYACTHCSFSRDYAEGRQGALPHLKLPQIALFKIKWLTWSQIVPFNV